MNKKLLQYLFLAACIVLALLACREWTVNGIVDNSDAIAKEKIDDGQSPITAHADADNAVTFVWLIGCCVIFVAIVGGGYAFSEWTLLASKQANQGEEESVGHSVPAHSHRSGRI